MLTGFFAYPSGSTPEKLSIQYTIEKAIRLINRANKSVEIKGWREMEAKPDLVSQKVFNEINDCDVFLCDLTHVNMNVLFELGYAIAINKPTWMCLDRTMYNKDRFYSELSPLTNLDRREYRNAEELMSYFLADSPHSDYENTLYNNLIEPLFKVEREPKAFYLKCTVPTDASNELTKTLIKSKIPLITDDPDETKNRSLEWYINSLLSSVGTIAHFLDESRDINYPQNAKYAFVCGLAYGLGQNPFMLAHAPHIPAIDYKDLMFVHQTPDDFASKLTKWIKEIREKYERKRKIYQSNIRQINAIKNLQRVNLGQYVAEDEKENLTNYFIRTAYYLKALNASNYMLFVGRRGIGKTANFYQMKKELESTYNKNYYISMIKPNDYDLKGLFEVFEKNISEATKIDLVKNLWKFLTYTELAFDLYYEIEENKFKQPLTDSEEKLIEFVNSNNFILADFTIRMERMLERINESLHNSNLDKLEDQRSRISEALHNQLISRLREILGEVLKDKDKVYILVDNLDKAWEQGNNLQTLSHFLFGFLEVNETISREFQRQDSRKNAIDLALIVFLRSDIFFFIEKFATERSKLKATIMTWDDPISLLRVIEERFLISFNHEITKDDIWNGFFCENVNGVSTRDYIVEHIIRRPRDIIVFCQQALFHAINRGHLKIEEDDIISAEHDYSKHAWISLLDETKIKFSLIEDFLVHFSGKNSIVTLSQLENFATLQVLDGELESIIEMLIEALFLGVETEINTFEYLYDNTKKKVIETRANDIAGKIGERRFRVNKAFHRFLEIKSDIP